MPGRRRVDDDPRRGELGIAEERDGEERAQFLPLSTAEGPYRVVDACGGVELVRQDDRRRHDGRARIRRRAASRLDLHIGGVDAEDPSEAARKAIGVKRRITIRRENRKVGREEYAKMLLLLC